MAVLAGNALFAIVGIVRRMTIITSCLQRDIEHRFYVASLTFDTGVRTDQHMFCILIVIE